MPERERERERERREWNERMREGVLGGRRQKMKR
jgi:hypothetical protein